MVFVTYVPGRVRDRRAPRPASQAPPLCSWKVAVGGPGVQLHCRHFSADGDVVPTQGGIEITRGLKQLSQLMYVGNVRTASVTRALVALSTRSKITLQTGHRANLNNE